MEVSMRNRTRAAGGRPALIGGHRGASRGDRSLRSRLRREVLIEGIPASGKGLRNELSPVAESQPAGRRHASLALEARHEEMIDEVLVVSGQVGHRVE